MEMADKAVSTEDLCFVEPAPRQNSTCVEVARLEGVLNSLLENKVEAIKNDRAASAHSSPKMLINRLRITSSSTVSSKDKDSGNSHHLQTNRKHRRRKKSDEIELEKSHGQKRTGRSRQRISSSSPESGPMYSIGRCYGQAPLSDEEADQAFLAYEGICSSSKCLPGAHDARSCCCSRDNNGEIQTFGDDYVSLKIEDFDDVEDDAIIAEEALKRARRKRRRRRKRRMKRHQIAMAAVPVVDDDVKVLEADELPQRARWTIVATAFLLLFMCLLLVGVTLRMAPIIDEMVRKENQELMNSLNRGHNAHPNFSTPVTPVTPKEK